MLPLHLLNGTAPAPPSAAGGICYTDSGSVPTGPALAKFPLARNSASRRPIGSGAIYTPVNHPANIDWRKYPTVRINSLNNFGHRWAIGQASDPLVSVTKNAEDGGGQGLPFSLRIPIGFTGGTEPFGADQGVTIYDATTNIVSQFFQFFRTGNGTATAKGRYTLDIDGVDWKSPVGAARHTSSASNIYQIGLLVRGHEVAPADGPPIAHAHGISMVRKDSQGLMQLDDYAIFPASLTDGTILTGQNTGNVPYGALFAILPLSMGGPDIDNMSGLTPQQRRLYQAYRDYGIYAVDGGGGGQTARGDQYVAGTGIGSTALRQSLVDGSAAVMEYFRMIENNAESDPYVVGGGTPIAPNCGWDSPNVTWQVWS